MDSNGEFIDIIRSYDDFMPYCKFLKEERFDTYQIPLHGFKIEQFIKLRVNDKKGTIKAEGQRPMGGSRLSRFRQEFKLHRNLCNTKDIHARFGNGVLPKRAPLMIPNSDDTSDLFVCNSKLFGLKIRKRAILRSIAIAIVGDYVTIKYLPSTQ
ncbi:inactive protein RESTRICTED TEV MOVEMENT 2-like [Pyrus ussuriensis x Pyrus communis]|uniref:Inactive protein RESTRICTED TEV MOVEMENT 2-like n=1 Tax=Pyrus ussuriensis x Pyrus communis TaxID=2448454 RepID=A0A5N5HUX7_9ROSA|nr:inactive protein RESTRICTED TEV MOVEMENT 2-like [Pyrus ussuriensis x Pyrus communis]